MDDTVNICYMAWKKKLCRHYSISHKKSYTIYEVAKLFKKKIKFLHKKANINLIKQIQSLELISAGNTIEYPIVAIKFLEHIAKKINKFDGGLLTFDYGYTIKKNQNTLQAVRKHKYSDPFFNPGNSDITSHINFKLFKEILTAAKSKVDPNGIMNPGVLIDPENKNIYNWLK